jgi:hypothetical protein
MRVSFALLALLLLPRPAEAVTLLPPCIATGDCGITDILVVFVNVAEFMLGITGAVALGFFVYGGFVWISSGGSPERVKKGRDILRNAVIGIGIIMLSGVIVRFTTEALTGRKKNFCPEYAAIEKTCVPFVGGSCEKIGGGDGLWVSIPPGYTDENDPANSLVPEQLMCILKNDCQSLNAELQKRHRTEGGFYECVDVSRQDLFGCVRGLCPSKGAGFACCLCKNCQGKLVTCPQKPKPCP